MRQFTAVAGAIAWFALALQLYLSIVNAPQYEISPALAICNYFSYFTVLSNILVALALTIPLVARNSTAGSFFSRPSVEAGVAVYIAVVALVYSWLLRHLWDPEGMQLVADMLLHDLVPLLYLVWWLTYGRRSALPWREPVLWLTYPILYVIYVVARGAFAGWYPYPFIDAGALGYTRALTNTFMMLMLFLIVGLIVVVTSRFGSPRMASRITPRS